MNINKMCIHNVVITLFSFYIRPHNEVLTTSPGKFTKKMCCHFDRHETMARRDYNMWLLYIWNIRALVYSLHSFSNHLKKKNGGKKTIDESTWNIYEFAIFLIHPWWRLRNLFLVAETTQHNARWQLVVLGKGYLHAYLNENISYYHPQFLNWIWFFCNFQSAPESTIFA